jgi:hypothetical protein
VETKSIMGMRSSFMMGENPAPSSAKPWTQEEIARLKTLMSENTPKNIIARSLGRSIVAVNHKSAELKLTS